METVSVETISEIGNSIDCQKNPDLIDNQSERSGKKRRKSRRRKSKLKNSDSHTSSQNGNADGAFSSEEKKEGEAEKSTNEDQVQLSENRVSTLPTATLHRTDPNLSTRDDSLPDANKTGSSRKNSKRRARRKKKDSSCEEKMLDDAEKPTNDNQVHLLNTPLSNGNTQDSCEKPGAAQLCTGPNLLEREDSQKFQNLGKTKEKKTDANTRKGKKKKKTSSADYKTSDMEVCEPSGSVEGLLGHSNEKDMQNCYGNARQEFDKSATRENIEVQKSRKRKEIPKVENIESNQDALGAEGVSDIGRKRQKRKIKKKTNCESVATMDSEAVQCLLYLSNREGVKNSDGNADGEIASKDLASYIEDSATKGESVQDVENIKKKKKDKKGEVNQDALGAEGVSKVEVTTKKSKKKKNSLDHKTDNVEDSKNKKDEKGEVDQNALGVEGVSKVEVKKKKRKKKKKSFDNKTDDMEEKHDVSLPRKDEEPECDMEKLETSLSSSVLIKNNMAQGVASSETGSVPRCSCEGQRTRKLVVFDLNGILADIVQGFTGQFVPDGKVSYRSVFRRPFVSSFLDFCFERFQVAIWSSRRIGLDYMVNIVMENYAKDLLFRFDQNKCTTTKFKTKEKHDKPLFLKELRTVWDHVGTCISCGKRKYDETNTLLVDDSPDKAMCNPPYTGIFPCPYQYTDRQDSALGPEGELRKYLERLADAENVQKFVAENPFGQNAITETHESWEFYSKVIDAHKVIRSPAGLLTM